MDYHHNHHIELHKALHDNMNSLYIYHSLLTFAKSLIGVFVPVYLFKLGFLVREIIFYSLLHSIIFLIVIPISIKIIKKIGFKYTLLLSMPIYLSHILCLNYISTDNHLFFYLSILTIGIYSGVFWPAYHSEVALMGSNKHRTSQMGTFQILATLFGTLSPIIGGYILDFSSYWYLLILASSLIVIGLIPLLLSPEKKVKKYDFGYKDYLRLLKWKRYKNSKLAFRANGLQSPLLLTLWPIILFIFLDQSYFELGILMTAVSLLGILIIMYIKAFFDKGNKNLFLKKTVSILSGSWFLKSLILFFGIMLLYVAESIARVTQKIFDMLYMSIFYNNAKKVGFMDYIIYRELQLHLTKIIFCFFLILFLLFFGESLVVLSAIVLTGIFIPFGFKSYREELV